MNRRFEVKSVSVPPPEKGVFPDGRTAKMIDVAVQIVMIQHRMAQVGEDAVAYSVHGSVKEAVDAWMRNPHKQDLFWDDGAMHIASDAHGRVTILMNQKAFKAK